MCQQNRGTDSSTKYIQVQSREVSPYCFGLAKVHSDWLLSNPRWYSPPEGVVQIIWADYLPHCPGLVEPTRHAKKKSQNMGVDQNLGTRKEFNVCHCF
jgi:hypothetical protein